MNPVSVLVVDGSDIVRSGLSWLLGQNGTTHVVGRAPNAAAARDLVGRLRPRVAIVRDRLPDTTGFELCEQISDACAVIMLLSDVTETTVSRGLTSGAKGLVHLDLEVTALHTAVRSVAQGFVTLDAFAAERLVTSLTQTALHSERALSPRELEVLTLVSNGRRSHEIAVELGLTVNSVRTYVRRALEKLGCSTRAEAAARLGRTFASEEAETGQRSRRLGA